MQARELPGVCHFGAAVRIHRETIEEWARNNAADDGSYIMIRKRIAR
jgi:hypothetical protein